MISRLDFIKKCAAGAALILFGGHNAAAEKKETVAELPPGGNPYEYNIDEFKKTDPGLVLYEESEPLPFREEPLKGIAAGAGEGIIAAGSGHIWVYDGKGGLKNKFKIKEEPNCISSDEAGVIYAGMMDHVEVYGPDGARRGAWSSLGEKAHITSVAAGGELVAVADYGSSRLWIFTKNGKLLRFIRGSFKVPSPYFSVKLDGEGNIWAVNPGHLRIEQYSPEGIFKKAWGRSSMDIDGFPGCCNPTHIAMDGRGNFFTSEKGIARVKKYDHKGFFIGIVAGPDKFREGAKGLDLALGASGRVYVADPGAKMVRVFVPVKHGAGNE